MENLTNLLAITDETLADVRNQRAAVQGLLSKSQRKDEAQALVGILAHFESGLLVYRSYLESQIARMEPSPQE